LMRIPILTFGFALSSALALEIDPISPTPVLAGQLLKRYALGYNTRKCLLHKSLGIGSFPIMELDYPSLNARSNAVTAQSRASSLITSGG
jgi:hypothetical protein